MLEFYFLGTVSVLEGISNVLFTLSGFEGCSHTQQYVNSIDVMLNVTGSIQFRVQNPVRGASMAIRLVGLRHPSVCGQCEDWKYTHTAFGATAG